MNDIAIRANISGLVAEYDAKSAALETKLKDFAETGEALKLACSVQGTYGQETIETGRVYLETLEKNLKRSAWFTAYNRLQIDRIATAKDKNTFRQDMAHPPAFNLDNIRATFGLYILDPRASILRGVAEAFSKLDPYYKSHEKVKIGVKGLPKRIILSGFNDWGSSYGLDQTRDVLNALAQFEGKPLLDYDELQRLRDNPDHCKETRGVVLKRFQNGNGHLFFEPAALNSINLALAEYYGDALADDIYSAPAKPQASTAVSKDLQYYPTPVKVVEKVLDGLYLKGGDLVLEPSCGDGRFLDGLRKRKARTVGCEIDPGRADQARAKNHNVHVGNFLQMIPRPIYDAVVMNPPFYGKHYQKHVDHAFQFLKPGGTLKAILPISAQLDHNYRHESMPQGSDRYFREYWQDLPTGAFSESGTNINTVILTLHKRA